MEEIFKDPVQFSKGINLRDLLTSEAEFHIDVDFKQNTGVGMINGDDDLFPDGENDDDSDTEDVLKIIEESIETHMLMSPEYQSFKELSAKMIDCLANGDVKILILEEGNGPLIPPDAEVTMHYAAYWEKASIPFDSSLTMNAGAPARICLGSGRILPGIDIALSTIKGPQARLLALLQPAVAWGKRGAPPRIKPEPALFVISVFDVKDVQAALRFNDLPTDQQTKYEVTIRTVKALHADAKNFFEKRKYKKAIKNYQQSMHVLSLSQPETKEEEDEIKKLKINVYVNLAVCYYKINKPKYVIIMIENLDRIIDVNTHCKALFYNGRAYQLLGNMDEALKYYKKALKLEPKNKEIGRTLADLDKYIKNSAKNEEQMWQSAFRSVPVEKKVLHNVDDDFQNGVREMCEELAGRNEYARFDLPTGLTSDEVDCIKTLTKEFQGLVVLEDGEGKRKKVTIVRND